MFTVKLVSSEGYECGFEAKDWGYCPVGDSPFGRLNFWYREAGNIGKTWVDTGKVYVMNSNGKTVASYDMNSYIAGTGVPPTGIPPTANPS